jgi:transposase
MIRTGATAPPQIRDIVEKWYGRFMHLNNWLIHGRSNLRAYRKDFYRRTAYKLAQENDILLMDPDDIARMARTPNVEDGTRRAFGGIRYIASPAELRESLQEAFTNAGKAIYYTVSAQGTSKTCSNCGHVKEKMRVTRVFSCAACGFSMDREQNAATNVLALFERRPGSFSTKLRVAKNLQLKKEEAQKQEDASVAAG